MYEEEETEGLLSQEEAEAANEFGEYVAAANPGQFGIEHSVGDTNVRQWLSGLAVQASTGWSGWSGWSWRLFGGRGQRLPVPESQRAMNYADRSESSGSLRSRNDLLGSEDEAPSAIMDAEQLSDGFARELIFGTNTISGERSGPRSNSIVSGVSGDSTGSH
ncbi:hypothetical protein CJU89_2188 [Yarrowia sp. B02]|nr:hypothetical protein CJU89_2188 [Yarrowia sp. B02]